MRFIFAYVAVIAVACGAEDNARSPVECAQSDRSGSYLLTAETVSGDCGDLPESVVRFAEGDLGEGCALVRPDLWSERGCKLERSVQCTDGANTMLVEGVTVQQDADGALITGTMTVTSTGPVDCLGTYRVRYSRL